MVSEMVDMISASRAYELNASLIEGTKAMFQRALDIGNGR
jgi:flagellar basal-body rod protein FlgC